MHAAAGRGHVPLVRFLHEDAGCAFDGGTLARAAGGGCEALLEWLEGVDEDGELLGGEGEAGGGEPDCSEAYLQAARCVCGGMWVLGYGAGVVTRIGRREGKGVGGYKGGFWSGLWDAGYTGCLLHLLLCAMGPDLSRGLPALLHRRPASRCAARQWRLPAVSTSRPVPGPRPHTEPTNLPQTQIASTVSRALPGSPPPTLATCRTGTATRPRNEPPYPNPCLAFL